MRNLLLLAITSTLISCIPDTKPEVVSTGALLVHINKNIENADEPYFKEIFDLWLAALDTSYVSDRGRDNLWARDISHLPEIPYYTLRRDVALAKSNGINIQCTVMGLIPVQHNHYMIKTMMTSHVNKSDTVNLAHINTIYAKQVDDVYQLVSSADYHRQTCDQVQVGDVSYFIHPNHTFDIEEGTKMNAYNQQIAEMYDIPPIAFSYFVANNGLDLLPMMGLDFFDRSYQAVQSGGMSDPYNDILYAGNNSSYYPHELIHLYNHRIGRGRSHRWLDEGIAALLGGSTGYEIEWHWQKLKDYLQENPDTDLEDITSLEGAIPNGEYTTDWIYAIGGLLCGQIRDKHGIDTLLSLLENGNSDEDYYQILQDYLGVDRLAMDQFIKACVTSLPRLSSKEMDKLAY